MNSARVLHGVKVASESMCLGANGLCVLIPCPSYGSWGERSVTSQNWTYYCVSWGALPFSMGCSAQCWLMAPKRTSQDGLRFVEACETFSKSRGRYSLASRCDGIHFTQKANRWQSNLSYMPEWNYLETSILRALLLSSDDKTWESLITRRFQNFSTFYLFIYVNAKCCAKWFQLIKILSPRTISQKYL